MIADGLKPSWAMGEKQRLAEKAYAPEEPKTPKQAAAARAERREIQKAKARRGYANSGAWALTEAFLAEHKLDRRGEPIEARGTDKLDMDRPLNERIGAALRDRPLPKPKPTAERGEKLTREQAEAIASRELRGWV